MNKKTEQNRRRAVLMCAGDYEPVELLRKAERSGKDPCGAWIFVAVDGGLKRLLDQGIDPDLVLGDFDSLSADYHPYLDALSAARPDKLVRLPCEKDDTDTMYAARLCLERGYNEFLLYGALGGRLDHTIANVQTIAWLKKQGACGYLMGKRTLVTVLEGEQVLLPEGFEGTFSLFALDSRVTGITLEGMKYPLSEADLENTMPLGVSNEVRPEERAQVRVRTGLALMILELPEDGGKDGTEMAAEIPDPCLLERRRL